MAASPLTRKECGAHMKAKPSRMSPMQQARWNEVRIFYLAESMYDIRKREDDFYFLAEYLASFGQFNPNAVIRHMIEFRKSPHTHPSRDEVVTLIDLAGYMYPEIQPFMGVPKSTFYDIINTIETDVYIHPCLGPDSIKEFAGFLEAYDKIQGGTFRVGRSRGRAHVASIPRPTR